MWNNKNDTTKSIVQKLLNQTRKNVVINAHDVEFFGNMTQTQIDWHFAPFDFEGDTPPRGMSKEAIMRNAVAEMQRDQRVIASLKKFLKENYYENTDTGFAGLARRAIGIADTERSIAQQLEESQRRASDTTDRQDGDDASDTGGDNAQGSDGGGAESTSTPGGDSEPPRRGAEGQERIKNAAIETE